MRVENIESFELLEAKVLALRQAIGKLESKHNLDIHPPVFRGQRSAKWGLAPTLERYSNKRFSVSLYNRLLNSVHNSVCAFTDKAWTIDTSIGGVNGAFTGPPSYQFMVYARHHGFPTPLLDWTTSIYVAMFFAFSQAVEDEDVAIYAYLDSLGLGKGGLVGEPQIALLGQNVDTHHRHFRQQAQYTVAVEADSDEWVYCSHSSVFEDSSDVDQDILYKFIMPGSQKHHVLERLAEMNINAFTLFSNEEALMETLAYQKIGSLE